METKNMSRLKKIIYHKTNELNGWKNVNKILSDYLNRDKTKENTK